MNVNPLVAKKHHIQSYLTEKFPNIGGRKSVLRAIKTFFNWLEDYLMDTYGYEYYNPAGKLQIKRMDKMYLPAIKEHQIPVLLNLCEDTQKRLLVNLLWDTGMRREEVATALIEGIDWSESKVKIIGKFGKERHPKFGDTTRGLLEDWIPQKQKDDGRILDFTYWSIGTVLRRLEKSSGIGCNPHCFRRGWAIYQIDHGVPHEDVARMGGWETTAMLEHYIREYKESMAQKNYVSPADGVN